MKQDNKNKYLKLTNELLYKMGKLYSHFDKAEIMIDDIYHDIKDIARIITEDIENKK